MQSGETKEDIIKKIIDEASAFCGKGTCGIGFQGGEPMLAGIEFYRNMLEYIKKEAEC